MLRSFTCLTHCFFRYRLLEFATNYFDVSTFQDGETKRALQRLVNKRAGKDRLDTTNGENDRSKKKQKNKK